MGRAPCCDKANVKKGPWSPAEDFMLKSYIEQHGTVGNWITLPQKIGLKRCGKSCRLRWLNYLRPNIKHGGFSEEEENIISTLYIAIGSRWSIIAAQLPGRTDNDVKNYWNTRLKKKLLAAQQNLKQQQAADCRASIDLHSEISQRLMVHDQAPQYNRPPANAEQQQASVAWPMVDMTQTQTQTQHGAYYKLRKRSFDMMISSQLYPPLMASSCSPVTDHPACTQWPEMMQYWPSPIKDHAHAAPEYQFQHREITNNIELEEIMIVCGKKYLAGYGDGKIMGSSYNPGLDIASGSSAATTSPESMSWGENSTDFSGLSSCGLLQF
ncbi:hypothetical protein Dimus_017274 [Dionaea muscipula]